MAELIRRYYASPKLVPKEELDEATAVASGLFHLAFFRDDTPLFIEQYRGGRILTVMYFRPAWRMGSQEEAALLEEHAARYGITACSVSCRRHDDDGHEVEELFRYTATGDFSQALTSITDDQGLLRRVEHMNTEGQLAEVVEYDYDDGQRVRARHYSPTGALLFAKDLSPR